MCFPQKQEWGLVGTDVANWTHSFGEIVSVQSMMMMIIDVACWRNTKDVVRIVYMTG